MDLRGRPPGWLHPHLGTTTTEGPNAYMVALRHVVVSLDADERWRSWWYAAGVPVCELGIVAEHLDHLRPSADIHAIPGAVRANFTCAVPDAAARHPADLLPLATSEVTGMLEVIRQALGLGPLPPVPPLPEPPAQARDLEVTRRPVPDEGPEVEQQGYLTLTQVQQFFGDEPSAP